MRDRDFFDEPEKSGEFWRKFLVNFDGKSVGAVDVLFKLPHLNDYISLLDNRRWRREGDIDWEKSGIERGQNLTNSGEMIVNLL